MQEDLKKRCRFFATRLKNHVYYMPYSNTWPEMIEFCFIYPDGAGGAINHYIACKYAIQVSELSQDRFHAVFKTKDVKYLLYLSTGEHSRTAENSRWMMAHNRKFLDFCKIAFTAEAAYLFYIHEIRQNKIRISGQTRDLIGSTTYHHILIKNQRYILLAKLLRNGLEDWKTVQIKWKNEFLLFMYISDIFPDAIFQYKSTWRGDPILGIPRSKCAWLGDQSLDILIPSIKIAVEYQGKQHYQTVEFFDRTAFDFDIQKARDEKKKILCETNGIRLIYWDYRKPITKESVMDILGITPDYFDGDTIQ